MDDLKPVTHLLAVNIASKKGMKLLHEGLQYLVKFWTVILISHEFFKFILSVYCHHFTLNLNMFITIIIIITSLYVLYLFFLLLIQIEASNRARVGVLFSVNQDADVSSHLFVKVFEITASSYRFVFISNLNGLSVNGCITHIKFSLTYCAAIRKMC